MSPSGWTIRDTVEAAVRRVRRDGAVAALTAVAALVPLLLLLVWAWGPGGWLVRGAGPLLLLTLAFAGACALAYWLALRWVRGVDDAAVAAAAERWRGLPEGSLRGVLELGRDLPAGASAALVRRSEADLSGQLAGVNAREVAGDVGERARRRRWRVGGVAGALVALTVLAAFAAPERARGSWSPLLSPVETLSAPALPPLVVHPGHGEVARGAPLEVFVEAPFRERVVVRWRATGDVPRAERLGLEAGRGSMSIGVVDAPLEYWVEAPDGATSERFRVRPVDPLLVSTLTVELVYPAHVGRTTDTHIGEPPPLRVPEGTLVRVRGETTRPLETVRLAREDGREIRAEARSSAFSLDWKPGLQDSGRWQWRITGTGVTSGAAPPAPLELSIIADLPPVVRITVPGPDTLMPAGLRQQVVADASDDHGIASAALVFRRVTAAGERGPERAIPLRIEAGADRMLLRTVLDASGETLLPGDAIHYRVVARDNSPGGQVASSAEHVLRLASMAELRERARSESDAALEEAERVAERTRDLQKSTRDLSRQAAGRSWERRAGSESRGPSQPSRLGFEEASQAKDVLKGHEELREEVAALEQRMAELQEAVDEAGLRDPELQRRLEELRELYRQLVNPEVAAELEALRQGVEALDPEAVREALDRLAAQQEELKRQMEESLAMMRRAAAEQQMGALSREAEEIAAQQEGLAEAMKEELPAGGPPREGQEPGDPAAGEPPSPADSAASAARPQGSPPPSDPATTGEESTPPSPRGTPSAQPRSTGPEQRAKQQEELGERTQKLNESMQSLRQQLLQIGEQEAAQQTGQAQKKGESAQQSQQQAAQQAAQQDGQRASQSGARAASQLGEAARQLESAREAMKEGWEQQVQQAVQQATQEALNLAQREEALRQQMEQAQQQGGAQQGQMMQQMSSEQAALQQGLQQLSQNLSEAGQQSGVVNREVAQSLARATLNMEQTLQAMQNGQMPVQQAGQTVESLNQLAMSLLQNDGQMQQQAGSPSQQAMQQLAQAAQQQASLNGQAGALAPMDLSRQAMQQQLQQMAQQQRSVARRVGTVSEQLGGQENVLGRLDQLSQEAEAIARELEGGRIDPEVRARQERLFNRLLDAGRSLEREEYNDERVGEGGEGVEAAEPPALDPALLDPALRYPAPTAERLRSLPPAYRRLILEYFDRLNRAAEAAKAATPAGGDGA